MSDKDKEPKLSFKRPYQNWKEVREKRDSLLVSSDWTQLIDAPLSALQKHAWRKYRQGLREITKQSDDPTNIVWPERPK